MRMRRDGLTIGALAGVLALAVLPTHADDGAVTGKVVDEQGKPVADADVASLWIHVMGELRPMHGATKTAADGSFRLDDIVTRGLLAMDAKRKRGAVIWIEDGGRRENLVVKLQKTVNLTGNVDPSKLPNPEDALYMNVMYDSTPHQLIGVNYYGYTFSFPVPPGDYTLSVADQMIEENQTRITVPAGVRSISAGTIAVQPSVLGKLIGSEMPEWSLTEYRGLPAGTKLRDLRGKWVVLEFWSHGCVPCVRFSLPRWIKFYKEHGDQRDGFEIVAVHANMGKLVDNLATVDKKTEEIRQKYWNDQPLPFPIALDGENATVKRLGVSAYPTHILIDPNGKVVWIEGGGSPTHASGVEERLAEELESLRTGSD